MSKKLIITGITSCSKCMLSATGYCIHPDAPEDFESVDNLQDSPIPDWCPLPDEE